jgi:hypothetical protein
MGVQAVSFSPGYVTMQKKEVYTIINPHKLGIWCPWNEMHFQVGESYESKPSVKGKHMETK